MKNPELYARTCEILYQAYFNDTLRHHNCYACAVGNIVAANLGLRFETSPVPGFELYKESWSLNWEGYPSYAKALTSSVDLGAVWYQPISKNRDPETVLEDRQIAATGYSVAELRQIEQAFEQCTREGDYMFNGLVAVLDCLKTIHEAEEDQQVARFTALRQSKSGCHVQ